jgi:hypothetical protein
VRVQQVPARHQLCRGAGQVTRTVGSRFADRFARGQVGRAPVQAVGGDAQGGSGIDDRALPDMQVRPPSRLDVVARGQVFKVNGHDGHQPVQGRHHGRQASVLAVPAGYRCLQVLTACAEEVPEHRRCQLVSLSQKPGDPLCLAGGVLAGGTVSSIRSEPGRFP